jgi:hypothetical protein
VPAKSKHGKGKHLHQSRRSKAIQRKAATTIGQNAAAETTVSTNSLDVPPAPRVKAESPKVKTLQYPFIVNELQRIGILAGIILIILIILAIILS